MSRVVINGIADDIFRDCDLKCFGLHPFNTERRNSCKSTCNAQELELERIRQGEMGNSTPGTNNLLLYGGLGLLAIMLLKR
jgi:hypothetical protein